MSLAETAPPEAEEAEATITQAAREEALAMYHRGALVWAKIHGFPHWPSQIRSLRPLKEDVPKIRVRFWFTNDDATLTLDKVEKYAVRVPMDPKKIKSKVVGKQYAGAIEIAARIVAAGATDGGAAAASINARKEGEGEEQEVPLSAWLTEGHSLCGVSVARTFGKTSKLFLGRVTRWLPAIDAPLFKVEHDDGDVEDLEEDEAREAHAAYARVAPAKQRAHEALVEKLIVRTKREALANQPKKPRSDYNFYVEAQRATVAAAHPEASAAEVSKLLAAQWREVGEEERQVYEGEAAEDLRRYLAECEARGVEVDPKMVHRQRSLRGPLSAQQLFKEDSEETFNIGADPEMLTPEVAALVEQGWADLTPEERAEYERRATIERTRHEAEAARKREARERRDGRDKRDRPGKSEAGGGDAAETMKKARPPPTRQEAEAD